MIVQGIEPSAQYILPSTLHVITMNKPLPTSHFGAIEMAPRDPILGITEAFNADPNPAKINLGVGVYYGDDGKVPLLDCVQKSEMMMVQKGLPHGYLPIDGLAAYDKAVKEMMFGADSPVIQEKRAITTQAVGGTGALKLGADLLKRFFPDAEIWISDPSWENHRTLFEYAGLKVNTYPYFDPTTRSVDFSAMIATLRALPRRAIVLLHACCHNPTGADLTDEQWGEVIEVVLERELIPFIDMAYQGFANSIEADGRIVRRFAEAGGPLLVSSSFSKTFSLYGERVGALSIVCSSADEAGRLMSQLKRIIRTNYSNPPMHGSHIVANVLQSPELRQLWEEELDTMRVRIHKMRQTLANGLNQKVSGKNFDFIVQQNGMFSYSGLTKEQVERLRNEFSVYAIKTGRICVAALNSQNIDRVIDAIAQVI